MISIADGAVRIQTSSEAQPVTPSWLGEVALVVSDLQKQGLLNKICECVRFARGRFGRYEVIDFLAVQIALCHQRRVRLHTSASAGICSNLPTTCSCNCIWLEWLSTGNLW